MHWRLRGKCFRCEWQGRLQLQRIPLLTISSPQVSEVAVVGVPSEKWGQKVTAIVVLSEMGKTAGKEGRKWSPLDMRRSLRERLANYKIPQAMKVVEAIPRNAMGKGKSGVSW